jgi:hypothetical protein
MSEKRQTAAIYFTPFFLETSNSSLADVKIPRKLHSRSKFCCWIACSFCKLRPSHILEGSVDVADERLAGERVSIIFNLQHKPKLVYYFLLSQTKMKRCNLLIFSFALSFLQVSSFLIRQNAVITPDVKSLRCRSFHVKSRSEDVEDGVAPKIPQLPVPGSSSFQKNQSLTSSKERPAKTAFVSRKFELQYTCNVCETRNCHMVSRLGK